MAKLNSQALICKQLKAGRLDLAARTWPAVRDSCSLNTDPEDFVLIDGLRGRDPRIPIWWAAADAKDPAPVLDWLAAQTAWFKPSTNGAIFRLKLLLSGAGTVKNLAVADWLVSRVGLTSDSIQEHLPVLFEKALLRSDGGGLDWIFKQGWDVRWVVEATDPPLLMQVLTKKGSGFPKALFSQMDCLLKQGVKPLACTGTSSEVTEARTPLAALALIYLTKRKDLILHGIRFNAQTEDQIAKIWCGLVDAGDDPNGVDKTHPQPEKRLVTGADPRQMQVEHVLPTKSISALSPRQRIQGTPLAAIDRAFLRQEKSLSSEDGCLPASPRRLRC